MKCFALIAALCFLGVCAGESLSLDFLSQNLLNPMLNQIASNAVNLLGQQLNDLIGGLFSGIGKRDLNSLINVNVNEVFTSLITKVKAIYEKVFQVFLQITQHAENWVAKPSLARIDFLNVVANAENELANIHLSAEFLQPLVAFVQQHFQALTSDFDNIIQQALAAAQKQIGRASCRERV